MRHILFKLEYLFSKSSMMQRWEMKAAMRIFLCSERSLSKRVKTGQCFSSHFRDHSTTSQHWSSHRDLALATMYRQGCRRMRYDANTWFLLGAEFHLPCLPQKLTTVARGRLPSLMQSLSPIIGHCESSKEFLTLLIKHANSKATDNSNRCSKTVLSGATRDFEHSNLEWYR